MKSGWTITVSADCAANSAKAIREAVHQDRVKCRGNRVDRRPDLPQKRLRVGIANRSQKADTLQPGRDLAQQRDALGRHVRANKGNARDVAARARQALDQTGRKRVGDVRHDDRDVLRRRLGGMHAGGRTGDNDIDLPSHELRRDRRRALIALLRKANVKFDIPVFYVSELIQLMPEDLDSVQACGGLPAPLQHADAGGRRPQRLCARRLRPRQ